MRRSVKVVADHRSSAVPLAPAPDELFRGEHAIGARWCRRATSRRDSSAGFAPRVRLRWSWIVSRVVYRTANIKEDPTTQRSEAHQRRQGNCMKNCLHTMGYE